MMPEGILSGSHLVTRFTIIFLDGNGGVVFSFPMSDQG